MESLNIEYKSEYVESIKKTIVAFANTDGGTLYIGIADNGEVIGVKNSDDIMLRVTNAIRDSISPDVSLFTKCKTEIIKNKKVVVVDVQRGSACPYYLKSKGIRPEGVYIRHGASTVSASEAMILKIIKENTFDNYEDIRSLNQELSFDTLSEEFKNLKLGLDDNNKRSLGILGSDNLYTNLGLLLSEQCTHTIKLAIFEGKTKNLFKDRYEFKGSLIKQLSDVYDTINRYNRTRAKIEYLKRQDIREYPPIAIREVLLNSLIHRDYSYSASTLISIYDDRMEFVSLGGLAKGITEDDIMLGISISRNKKLADIFYRLKYIEAYGTGIGKLIESYEGFNIKPQIKITNNAFKVILPNTMLESKQYKEIHMVKEELEPTQMYGYNMYLSDKEERIIEILKRSQSIKRKDIEEEFNISQTMSIKLLKRLLDKNLIKKYRKGREIYYKLS